MTPSVVLPYIVAATQGLCESVSCSLIACTAPTTAPAAMRKTLREMRFTPEISTMEFMTRMSFPSTYAPIFALVAIVETMTLGKPEGSVFIASSPMIVPAPPPRAIRPSICPAS